MIGLDSTNECTTYIQLKGAQFNYKLQIRLKIRHTRAGCERAGLWPVRRSLVEAAQAMDED
jgi:hypothetical protein